MFEKHKLTSIVSYDKGKDGQPLKTKDGRPYTRLVIKTEQMNDTQMSGFAGQATQDWKVGDEINIKVEKVAGQNGAIYYNFSTPKKEDLVNERLVRLESDVRKIKKYLEDNRPKPKISGTDIEYPEEPLPEDIPF